MLVNYSHLTRDKNRHNREKKREKELNESS